MRKKQSLQLQHQATQMNTLTAKQHRIATVTVTSWEKAQKVSSWNSKERERMEPALIHMRASFCPPRPSSIIYFMR